MKTVMSGRGEPKWFQLKRQGATAVDILGALGVSMPPIDIFGIVQVLGVELKFQDNPGWDGAVRSEGNRAAIWVNNGHALVRQRFTVAHELGHLMLHPDGVLFRDAADSRGSYNPREQQANHFAAEILMPAWALRRLASEFGPEPEKLARVFLVSSGAMSYRIRNLFL